MKNNIRKKVSDKIGALKGRLVMTFADGSSAKAKRMEKRIIALRDSGQMEKCSKLIREFNKLFMVRRILVPNMCVKVGRTMIVNNLTSSSPTNAMRITYGAVGTNAAAPTDADTQLGTELARATVASATNSDNVGYVTLFFGYSAANGALKEAGLFSDASATVNSGVLVSHAAINVTKANTNTLTIDWTLTLNDA
jgi:hypothetical protein